jgi:hypothetical protein
MRIIALLFLGLSLHGQSVILLMGTGASSGGTVATPTTSNSGGSCTGSDGAGWTCTGTTVVTFASATSGAAFCSTSDGVTTPTAPTPPTCGAGTNANGISTASTTTYKVIGTKSGLTNSAVLTVTYTISGGGSPTYVSSNSAEFATGGTADTVSITPTAGDTLIIGVGYYNSNHTPASVKTSDGTACVQDSGGFAGHTSQIYRCASVAGGITGVVASESGFPFPCIAVYEFSGIATLNSASTAPNFSSGTTWTSMTISQITTGIPVVDVGYVFGADGASYALSAGSGYTIQSQANAATDISCGIVYKIESVAGSTFTPNGTSASAISATSGASYK